MVEKSKKTTFIKNLEQIKKETVNFDIQELIESFNFSKDKSFIFGDYENKNIYIGNYILDIHELLVELLKTNKTKKINNQNKIELRKLRKTKIVIEIF